MILRRRLLPGPVLIGFAELFDGAYGNPSTPRDKRGAYPVITPSRVGYALLPFACPYCGEARCEVVDPKRRMNYYDETRGFSWCPACQGRFILNPAGRPLEAELPAGADYAPALIERDGKTAMLERPEPDALELLGVW